MAACGFGDGDDEIADTTAPPVTIALTDVSPKEVDVDGGGRARVFGVGFTAGNAGTPTVQIGGVTAADVEVISDTELTFVVPAAAPGPVTVSVRNGNGEALLNDALTFRTFVVYAADGKAGVPGNLYEIDPTDGTATPIGPIGYAITGMAMSPTGVLFATESTRRGALGDSRLIRIDTTSGAGTPVGLLADSGDDEVHQAVADITFVDNRLVGWSQRGDVPVEIDTGTGRVTVIGDSVNAFGAGLAFDGRSRIYLAAQGSEGPLYSLDPSTGTSTAGPLLGGGDIDFSSIGAMTFLGARLLGVDIESGRSADTRADLIEIDPATGLITRIGALPTGIDALATD